jgi:hypothetical protein
VFNESFEEYIEKDFDGKRFNVIHCDFPYGISHHKSGQAGTENWGEDSYEDDPEIFKHLIDTLQSNIDKLTLPTAHMIFWYPVHLYSTVFELWSLNTDFKPNPVPLIWYKSDNIGILPDAQRGPRRVYEAALFLTRGDRQIVRPVANAIAHPSGRAKRAHPSEKPLAVVSHFLSMVVDEYAILLDPTCGSGTALVAAEALGAQRVAGVELSKEHAQTARRGLSQLRLG